MTVAFHSKLQLAPIPERRFAASCSRSSVLGAFLVDEVEATRREECRASVEARLSKAFSDPPLEWAPGLARRIAGSMIECAVAQPDALAGRDRLRR